MTPLCVPPPHVPSASNIIYLVISQTLSSFDTTCPSSDSKFFGLAQLAECRHVISRVRDALILFGPALFAVPSNTRLLSLSKRLSDASFCGTSPTASTSKKTMNCDIFGPVLSRLHVFDRLLGELEDMEKMSLPSSEAKVTSIELKELRFKTVEARKAIRDVFFLLQPRDWAHYIASATPTSFDRQMLPSRPRDYSDEVWGDSTSTASIHKSIGRCVKMAEVEKSFCAHNETAKKGNSPAYLEKLLTVAVPHAALSGSMTRITELKRKLTKLGMVFSCGAEHRPSAVFFDRARSPKGIALFHAFRRTIRSTLDIFTYGSAAFPVFRMQVPTALFSLAHVSRLVSEGAGPIVFADIFCIAAPQFCAGLSISGALSCVPSSRGHVLAAAAEKLCLPQKSAVRILRALSSPDLPLDTRSTVRSLASLYTGLNLADLILLHVASMWLVGNDGCPPVGVDARNWHPQPLVLPSPTATIETPDGMFCASVTILGNLHDKALQLAESPSARQRHSYSLTLSAALKAMDMQCLGDSVSLMFSDLMKLIGF